MKSEFVVSKIEASQDETKPFVYVVFTDINISNKGKQQQQQSPFGGMGMNFTSLGDLMKNFSKIFSGGSDISGLGTAGMNLGESPTIFKLSIREYEESGFRVGDKITIEIKKTDNTGI